MQQAPVGLQSVCSAVRTSLWLGQAGAGACPAERQVHNTHTLSKFSLSVENGRKFKHKNLWVFFLQASRNVILGHELVLQWSRYGELDVDVCTYFKNSAESRRSPAPAFSSLVSETWGSSHIYTK